MTDAFDRGYDAYRAGAKLSENPYDPATINFDEWNHGWIRASWAEKSE